MVILETICAKYLEYKARAVHWVRWAEEELKGKTGAEKRAAVVAKLDAAVKLPWLLDDVLNLDGRIIGLIVDKICNAMNILTDRGDWGEVTVSDGKIAAVSELNEEQITAFAASHKTEDVNERFEGLLKEYGITAYEPKDDGGTNGPSCAELTDDDWITENFRLSEFECKCGCGKDDISAVLVNMLQRIRNAVGEPVTVNSGCRCEVHNRAVGGVENSWHTQGIAADITCKSGAGKLFSVIKTLYADGALPELAFCQYYPSKDFVHVDCGGKRKAVFSVQA